MKIKRHIAGLLLVCFSVFLGHNLVPHHHHSEVINSPIATACPVEHGDHQGHDHDSDADTKAEEHPIHCHAFNDVVFVKYKVPINNPATGQLLSMVVSWQAIALEEPLMLTSSLYILLKLPGKSHTDLGTRALRGPPVFA
jgi:hypothetical protein